MLKLKLLRTIRLFKNRPKALLFFITALFFLFFYVREQRRVLNFSPQVRIDDLQASDCGVVLTGAPGRLREGFEILAQRKIKKLIISGVYKDTKLSEIFPLLPYYPEINAEDIILEKVSGSTFENAIHSLGAVEGLKCRNIILITSQLHMYRAHRTFKFNFPKNFSITEYPVINATREDGIFDENFETFKSLFYSIMSFIPNMLRSR